MISRVLVVEDEYLIAMQLQSLLKEMGYEVVGPVARMEEGMELARAADIDVAVLDINLGGIKSFPIAAMLRKRGIPFVFASGYGSDGLEDGYRQETTLQKPYDPKDLRQALLTVLSLSR